MKLGVREEEAAEKGRGQFITRFECPAKEASCFPVADGKPVRVNTQITLLWLVWLSGLSVGL